MYSLKASPDVTDDTGLFTGNAETGEITVTAPDTLNYEADRGFTYAVVLVVTGGEALYADMGHFGKRPIRLAWLCLVWLGPCLACLGLAPLGLALPGLAWSTQNN